MILETANDPLDLEIRKKVYDTVKKSPGIHFRELQRRIHLATGSLDYHVHFLVKNKLLRAERSEGFVHYYVTSVSYEKDDKDLRKLLRNEHMRHIVVFLLENKRASALKIAEHVGVSSSNLSRYLKTLEEKETITYTKQGRYRFYRLRDKERIINHLLKHKKGFVDKMVDSFIDAWTIE